MDKQEFYEGYLTAKYGARDDKGHRCGYFEYSKEMAICAMARANNYWPIPAREPLLVASLENSGVVNGQGVRDIALKHLAEIDPQYWPTPAAGEK